ncbi:MAG TPA: LuxR C-terminal-related transcriptional regulator [Xanthobacteraceae bacterium]|nr:LuxR C-terminal-related transcriptional regulator [Xanthobacteraceae bacterium]
MSYLTPPRSMPAPRQVPRSVDSAGGRRGDDLPVHLIGQIYDAALEPGLWPEVLACICDFVGGRAGGIISKDSISKASTPHFHFGIEPHYLQIYSKTHSRLEPMSNLASFDVEQVVSLGELLPHGELCDGRFFHEWMRPQDLVDAAHSVLEKSALSASFLAIFRDRARGAVDDEMRGRMALIVPHVRRAALIGQAIDLKQTEAAIFADTLDGLGAGMFLLAVDGRIVHANAAGRGTLSAGDLLRSIHGRLSACDAKAHEVLRGAIAAAGDGSAGIGGKGIVLALTARDGERYVVRVLPLTPDARRGAGYAYKASAALFLHKAALGGLAAPEVIGKVYNLTPAELRVLLGIVEVGGVPEVAAALGVADTTIKTHLGRLFEKTGARRQADLVKLVAGFATPLAA